MAPQHYGAIPEKSAAASHSGVNNKEETEAIYTQHDEPLSAALPVPVLTITVTVTTLNDFVTTASYPLTNP